jgi:hypothetical protein
MRRPQWAHDFEPIPLGFRFATHPITDAITATNPMRNTSTTRRTSISGKPMLRMVHSLPNVLKCSVRAGEVALALVQQWSLIQIGVVKPSPLDQWRIIPGALRPNLTLAVLTPGDGEISSAVKILLDELSSLGVTIHDSRFGFW